MQELWDNVCLQTDSVFETESVSKRRLKGIGTITDVSSAITVFSMVVGGSAMCYVKGGTHNVAHACQRIFLENGGEFHTKQHVDRLEETLTASPGTTGRCMRRPVTKPPLALTPAWRMPTGSCWLPRAWKA